MGNNNVYFNRKSGPGKPGVKRICQLTAPSPTPPPPNQNWKGDDMKLTHYWDCSGQGCDATVLQPWDKSLYVSPPGYGPQDPNDHDGALYGEKMWLTGAASD